MQRPFFVIAMLALAICSYPQQGPAQISLSNQTFPGADWARWEKPEAAGYRSRVWESAEQMLYKLPTTSMMVVVSGKIAYTYGDVDQVSYLASARKSIMS